MKKKALFYEDLCWSGNLNAPINITDFHIVIKNVLYFILLMGPKANAPKQDTGTGDAPPAVEDEEKKKQKRGMI